MSRLIDELPEGGMGIKIMSHIADELSYTRTSTHRNCLSIVKNYEQQSLDSLQALSKGSFLERSIKFFKHLFKYKVHILQDSTAPLQKIHLQVNTNLNELDQILQWFDQLEHLPKAVWCECRLALAEGFTNAVRHAHKGLPPETPIELEVIVFKRSLNLRIWDYGQPFDLEAKIRQFREIDQQPVQGEGENRFKICATASCS